MTTTKPKHTGNLSRVVDEVVFLVLSLLGHLVDREEEHVELLGLLVGLLLLGSNEGLLRLDRRSVLGLDLQDAKSAAGWQGRNGRSGA